MPSLRSSAFVFGVSATLAISVLAMPFDAHAAKRKASSKPKQPMTLVVDLRRQRVRAYAGVKQIWSSGISSGKRGHRTPTGVFSIIQKRARHFSNIYNNAPMPHMQRLTWSGIAFHGGPLPGYPASHGCVRLPYGKARQLFRLTRMSTRTIVTYSSPRPSIISHAALWDKLPAELPGETDNIPPANDREPGQNLDNASETPVASVTRERVQENAAQLVSSVLGVSEARASATHDSRTMAGARDTSTVDLTRPARSLAEVKARQSYALRTAENAMVLAETRARLAKSIVDTHTRDLISINKSRRAATRARGRAIRDAKRAERSAKKATAALRRLLVRNVKIADDSKRLDKLAEREDELDTRLADSSADARLAREAVSELEMVLDRLSSRRTALMAKLKAARLDHRQIARAWLKAKSNFKSVEDRIALHDRPVQILVSRSKSKIYLRQGYKDVYEADISFVDPDQPIGTHVLTAIDAAEDGTSLRWSALTVPDRKFGRRARTSRSKKTTAPRLRLTARRALDRMILPDEVQQRIREVIKVGSSVILSDRGPSHETGKGTDFVVLTR